MKMNESMIGNFVSNASEIEHNGAKVSPEVQVSVAVGKVTQIEEAGKDLVKITMRVSGAKFPYGGYINASDPVAQLLKEAHEKDIAIAARFEKKRKPKVDPTTPIEELTKDMNVARDNIVRVVSGVYNINAESWVLSKEAQSNPKDDPASIESKILNSAVNTDNFFDAPKNVKVQGSVDDKANQLISMYYYISERAKEYEFELPHEKLIVVAKRLLRLCDMLQTSVYNLDAANYRDYSHTRARFMLFSWERLNPLNKEALQNFNDWGTRFLEENKTVWVWAIKESTPEATSDQ